MERRPVRHLRSPLRLPPAPQPRPRPVPASSAIPPTTSAQNLPVLLIRPLFDETSSDYAIIRPESIASGGSADPAIVSITWTYWSTSGALGHGLQVLDNCTPDCASGAITKVPATVVLSLPVNGQFTSMAETSNGQTETLTGPELLVQNAEPDSARVPLPNLPTTEPSSPSSVIRGPVTTPPTSGAAPCTDAAITAAARAVDGTTFHGLDTSPQSFGCSGRFAYAFALVGSENKIEADVTILFMATNGTWQPANRAMYCPNGSVPQQIYQQACETQ